MMGNFTQTLRQAFGIAIALASALGNLDVACAQVPLEYSPYEIGVFISLENPADLNANAQQKLAARIVDLSRAHLGAPWTLNVHFAADALAGELLVQDGEATVEQLLELTPVGTLRDKVFYVVLGSERSHWHAQLQELDLRTFRLSPGMSKSRIPHARLAEGLLDAMVEAFSPVVKLDVAQRDVVTGTLQAAALVVDPDSPVMIAQGDPLLPVIRHNDRLGRAGPTRVLPIPWTVLGTLSIEQHQVSCQIHSAHNNPLGRTSRLRLVRYAQATRYPAHPIELTLRTPGGDPLVDYEIVERDPAGGSTATLARTGEAGIALLPASPQRWQLLYVRHGDRVMARLPVVSGVSRRYVAELPSDDIRLAAEGFVAAFRQEIVDTVARRQILAARIRRHIALGEFEQAQALLEQLRGLASATEFIQRLSEAKVTLMADNARAQQLIDQMFAQTRQMLLRYLDPNEVNALSQQLAAARAEG